MQRWKLLILMMLGVALTSCATVPQTRTQTPADQATAKRVVITGSRIPREVEPSDLKSASTYPLYVVTEEEIERSGEPLIGEYLRRLPFFR